MGRNTKVLSDKEIVFVDAYVSNGFDRKAALRQSGIKSDNVPAYAASVLKRPLIIAAIAKKLEKKRNAFFVQEMDILEGLYKEANLEKSKGGTQQGRIAAWTQIGKHLGMFDSKVKELTAQNSGGKGTTINIMNYNTEGTSEKKSKEKDITSEAQESETEILDNVKLEDYSGNKE